MKKDDLILKTESINAKGLTPQFEDCIDSVLSLLKTAEFEGAFKYDVLSENRCINRQLPWMDKKKKVFENADMDRIIAVMQKFGIRKASNVRSAMNIIFDENQYNPFIEKLEKWDREVEPTGRFSTVTFFQDFLGVTDCDYSRICSQMFFKSIIARNIYDAEFQYFLVIIGEQGIGKDTTLRKIIPSKDWLNGNYQFDNSAKNNVENAKGNILCVLNDFNGFTDDEFTRFKAFISTSTPVARISYKRKAVKHHLNCIFVATTNNETIVPDQAGNRRYLPLRCNPKARKFSPWQDLTIQTVKELWVEAYRDFKQNNSLYAGAMFDNLASNERKKYFEQDP
ncbi:MAG: VapE domain-containing protein, partial [Bacteroidales bacterium]